MRIMSKMNLRHQKFRSYITHTTKPLGTVNVFSLTGGPRGGARGGAAANALMQPPCIHHIIRNARSLIGNQKGT